MSRPRRHDTLLSKMPIPVEYLGASFHLPAALVHVGYMATWAALPPP